MRQRHFRSQSAVAPSPDLRDEDAANDGPDYALFPLHLIETTARSFLPQPRHRSRPLRSSSFAAGLNTNDGDASFTASRPLILTGINNLATRGDLADRCLPFHLSEIMNRKTDVEIQEGFSYAHPRVLAGLLDIMVVGLRRLEEVQRGRRPLERMADFTQWGYAVAPAIGWAEDDFRLAYRATRREAQHTVIDSDPVAAGILALVHGAEHRGRPWRGLQSGLWKQLADAAGDAARAPGFPRSPEALGWALSGSSQC